MSTVVTLMLFAGMCCGMCCALQWKWFATPRSAS
jgi:hypothetical protein